MSLFGAFAISGVRGDRTRGFWNRWGTAKGLIFMGHNECQECGASVIIEDDVPRLPREGEPD